MAQYNINPPDDYRRDSGMGTVLAVLLVLALVAFLIWALAFGGFNSLTGAGPAATSPGYSTTAGASGGSAATNRGSTSGSGVTGSGSGSTTGSGATSSGAGYTTGGSTSGSASGTTSRP